MTEDTEINSDLPVETLFDDLAVFNVFFPLSKFTRPRWQKQPRVVRENVFVADVQDIHISESRTLVTLRTSGDFDLRLKRYTIYRLSPRLVNFNVTKILSTLVELDLQTPSQADYVATPPFLQLFAHTGTFAKESCEWESVFSALLKSEAQTQALYRNLVNLDNQAAASLLLKTSQRKALRRILRYRLSVIWGPPGKIFPLKSSYMPKRAYRYRYREDIYDIVITAQISRSQTQL